VPAGVSEAEAIVTDVARALDDDLNWGYDSTPVEPVASDVESKRRRLSCGQVQIVADG
jgi:hypothetical protein